MIEFADSLGRQWVVRVSAGTVKACRELLSLDLCDIPSDFDLLQRLRSDDAILANVLYVCCRKQAEERGVSDEDFGELLAGEVIEAAEEAFWESLTFFFRGGRREQLSKALSIQKQMESDVIKQLTPERQEVLVNRVTEAAGKTIDEILREVDFTGDSSN